MNTDQLIDQLSNDVQPVGTNTVGRRLAIGMAVGAIVSLAIIVATIGTRPDLGLAMRGYAFWMKWAYTLSLSSIAIDRKSVV